MIDILKLSFIGILSFTAMTQVASANQFILGPAPARTGLISFSGPACASSANGTAHLICVYGDHNDNLFAFSLQTQSGHFPVPALDPAKGNPLSLGVTGTIESSGCASTADASGDVVCAYTANGTTGQLMGIRFNIFNGKIYPVMNLGFSIFANPTCTNGSERFKVAGPPTQEGPNGATICVAESMPSGFLRAVAFNPATGFLSSVTGTETALPAPTCTNANDGTQQVICVYNNGGSLRSVALNTNPLGFASAELSIYPDTTVGFFDDVSCSAPNDGSGDVLCAALNSKSNELMGFAVNPRTGHRSAPQNLMPGTLAPGGTVGSGARCAGVGDNSATVICSFFDNIPTAGNRIYGVKFDPRTGFLSNVQRGTVSGVGGVDCTFQNANAAQISCAFSGSDSNLVGLIFNP